jgi:hypothetical protein
MSINSDELAALQADFQRVTGQVCRDFYCPILNEFGEGSGLMDGHVLPRGIRSASRATVIQRADVDNPFGVIEAGLCNFINKPLFDLEELYRRSKGMTVTGKDGTPVSAFFASRKSSPPYPILKLSTGGETIASPYIKTAREKMDDFRGKVDVEGELVFSQSALAVSLIKSAHLALFKLLGYGWVFDPAGQYVSSALARILRNRVSREAVRNLSDELPNCFNWLREEACSEDTLSSRMIVFHFEDYDGSDSPLEQGMETWGLSCLFRMNDHLFLVTLPYSSTRQAGEAVLNRYRRFMTGDGMRHSACVAWVRSDGCLEISKKPMNVTAEPRPDRSPGADKPIRG